MRDAFCPYTLFILLMEKTHLMAIRLQRVLMARACRKDLQLISGTVNTGGLTVGIRPCPTAD